MFRKIAFGLFASVAIGAAALSPAAVSAHPLGWDWGLGSNYHGTLDGPTTIASAPESCIQKTPVQTHHTIRFRTVNVCAF
jgi:hypothetical protein